MKYGDTCKHKYYHLSSIDDFVNRRYVFESQCTQCFTKKIVYIKHNEVRDIKSREIYDIVERKLYDIEEGSVREDYI